MKLLIVCVLALVSICLSMSVSEGLAEARQALPFCNIYTCVAETATCETQNECFLNAGNCNICQGRLGCFQGVALTDTCRSAFIGLSCDDGSDCGGLPNERPLRCGTDKLCRTDTTNNLYPGDYCCDDCECIGKTCINGACMAIADNGECDPADFGSESCSNLQFCNQTTTPTCDGRIADGAALPAANFQCLFGAAADSPSTGLPFGSCRQYCSVAAGGRCRLASQCNDGLYCNDTIGVTGVCLTDETTGLGDACNDTTGACDAGQVCQCDHNTGSQTCVAEAACCSLVTAMVTCGRANNCAPSSSISDPRSCLRVHCGNEYLAMTSCATGNILPTTCQTTSFPNNADGPNRSCGSAGVLSSWVSLLF